MRTLLLSEELTGFRQISAGNDGIFYQNHGATWETGTRYQCSPYEFAPHTKYHTLFVLKQTKLYSKSITSWVVWDCICCIKWKELYIYIFWWAAREGLLSDLLSNSKSDSRRPPRREVTWRGFPRRVFSFLGISKNLEDV